MPTYELTVLLRQLSRVSFILHQILCNKIHFVILNASNHKPNLQTAAHIED